MRIELPNPEAFSILFQKVTGVKPESTIEGIATDSREVKQGYLYIAIKGDRVDGHQFLPDVFERGAVSALVQSPETGLNHQQVLVDDPIKTIGFIANFWRKKFQIPIIGITGTNGKTSTKELLKHVLSKDFEVHATEGNFNTSIGLPLTLLQLTEKHDYSLLEMGASLPGDIAELCEIADPTHGIITNVAPAHLEGFGTIDEVTKTKEALFRALTDGIAFVNQADPRVANMTIPGESISFGLSPDCDFPADIHQEENGSITLTIDAEEIPTESQNLSFAKNIIAVAAIARTLGISWSTLKSRVLTFEMPGGRCQVNQVKGITIIDDTYNANLESTIGAIDYLKAFSGEGKTILVFGDMFELGESARDQHQKVGEKCVEAGLSHVFMVGNETVLTDEAMNGSLFHRHYETKADLLAELKPIIQKGDKILVKGSRGMTMETIVEALLKI